MALRGVISVMRTQSVADGDDFAACNGLAR